MQQEVLRLEQQESTANEDAVNEQLEKQLLREILHLRRQCENLSIEVDQGVEQQRRGTNRRHFEFTLTLLNLFQTRNSIVISTSGSAIRPTSGDHRRHPPTPVAAATPAAGRAPHAHSTIIPRWASASSATCHTSSTVYLRRS